MSRVDLKPSFVLHRRPYRETSLLVEAFCADFGRVGLVAKGATRGKSPLASVLQPFRPLLLSWSGGGDLYTLTRAEQDGPVALLDGTALKSGFYLNELLVRLLHRHDPHPELFQSYQDALSQLGVSGHREPVLRVFEKRLLAAIGYGLVLDRVAETGRPIDPEEVYRYRPDHGPVADGQGSHMAIRVRGSTLVALARETLVDAQGLREAKHLMRNLLRAHLGEKPLASRALFRKDPRR